jgi:hypothetical protein
MKFSNKRQQFEGSNVSFNPNTMIAKSYDWWVFVAEVNGKVIFNNSRYSNTTNRHQSKVRAMMHQSHSIDLVLHNTRESLAMGEAALVCEIKNTKELIGTLEAELLNPKRKKALDTQRQNVLLSWKEHVLKVETVLFGSELNASLN